MENKNCAFCNVEIKDNVCPVCGKETYEDDSELIRKALAVDKLVESKFGSNRQ